MSAHKEFRNLRGVVGIDRSERLANTEGNLLKTTILGDELNQNKSKVDVFSSLSKPFNRQRLQLYAQRVALFQTSQNMSFKDEKRDCKETLAAKPITQLEQKFVHDSETATQTPHR